MLPVHICTELYNLSAKIGDSVLQYIVEEFEQYNLYVYHITDNGLTVTLKFHNNYIDGELYINRVDKEFEIMAIAGEWTILPMRGNWDIIEQYLAKLVALKPITSNITSI